MNDYSAIIAKRRQNAVLDQIIAECVRLKDIDIPIPSTDNVIENKIFKLYNSINYTLPVLDKCENCQYAYDVNNYRCIQCHRFRELESTTIELPNDILYKIFKEACVSIREISKDLRNLVLPEITRNLLANIWKIDSTYVIRISQQYERFDGNYRYYSVGKYGGGELTNFCYYDLKCGKLVTDAGSCKPFYVTMYHVHIDPVSLTNKINDNCLLTVTTEQIAKAIEIDNTRDIGFRLAYAIARAWSLGKDVSFPRTIRYRELNSMEKVEEIIQRLL